MFFCIIISCKKDEKVVHSASKSIDSVEILPRTEVEDSLITKEKVVKENPVKDSVSVPVGDTTENSVDWAGTYKGTLPCTACPGIEMTLSINKDKSYFLSENYLGDKGGTFEESGNIQFDESGSFIILVENGSEIATKVFFVGENQIWKVKKRGDRSMQEGYKLTKK